MARETGKRPTLAVSAIPRPGLAPWTFTLYAVVLTMAQPSDAHSDEGGVAFWLSGQYAALAAVPVQPGWSMSTMLYYDSGSVNASVTTARGDLVTAGLDSRTLELFFAPTYAPRATVLGGQLALSLSVGFGGNWTATNQSVSASGIELNLSDTVWGLTDVSPTASLAWTSGVNNWMVYLTGNIPAGAYDSNRLSNLGIGHAAVDAGVGYTYFNSKTGVGASAVIGFTYNFENYSTDYRNGIDSHLDWSVSKFVSPAWQIGIAGYVYYQLTGDSGSGDKFGPFKSRVAGIGPQVSYQFTVAGQQWTAALRGYYEFWAQNRLEGYTLFATLNIPLGGGKQ